EGEHNLAVLDHCGPDLQPGLPRRFERSLQCRSSTLALGFFRPLAHGAPRCLVSLLAFRWRVRRMFLPVRSARNSSMYDRPSAVWNARSRIDRLVMRARGGKPLGSSGLIDIHIVTSSST